MEQPNAKDDQGNPKIQQEKDEMDQDVDDVINNLDNKLNITQDEIDKDDDELDPEIEKEYNNFLSSLQNNLSGSDNLDNFDKMMENLLHNVNNLEKDLKEEAGSGQEKSGAQAQQANFAGYAEKANFDSLISVMLNEIINKDILEEPLKDAQQNYQKVLSEKKDTMKAEDFDRYTRQLECINQICDTLAKDPDNKTLLIEKFEHMQEFGNPPPEIVQNLGFDAPINIFQQLFKGTGQPAKTSPKQEDPEKNPKQQVGPSSNDSSK